MSPVSLKNRPRNKNISYNRKDRSVTFTFPILFMFFGGFYG